MKFLISYLSILPIGATLSSSSKANLASKSNLEFRSALIASTLLWYSISAANSLANAASRVDKRIGEEDLYKE
jgi:hypothetical protein